MLVGPCGATGPDGQPMPGVLVGVDPCRQRSRCQAMCWAGRLAAFIAEALSGSGSPASRRWGACSLGIPPATTRNEQVDQWRALSAGVSHQEPVVRRVGWRRVGDF